MWQKKRNGVHCRRCLFFSYWDGDVFVLTVITLLSLYLFDLYASVFQTGMVISCCMVAALFQNTCLDKTARFNEWSYSPCPLLCYSMSLLDMDVEL